MFEFGSPGAAGLVSFEQTAAVGAVPFKGVRRNDEGQVNLNLTEDRLTREAVSKG